MLASDVGNPSKTEVIRNAVMDWPSCLCQNESREETVCLNHLGWRDKEARNEDHGGITKSASRSILFFCCLFFFGHIKFCFAYKSSPSASFQSVQRYVVFMVCICIPSINNTLEGMEARGCLKLPVGLFISHTANGALRFAFS